MTDETEGTQVPHPDSPEATEPSGCQCGRSHDVDFTAFNAEMVAVEEAIAALDPERRNLFTATVLRRVETLLNGVLERMVTDPDANPARGVAEVLAIASASVELLGLVATANRDEQDDWTRTQDSKVDAIWSQFIDLLRRAGVGESGAPVAVQIVPDEDLPRDLMERVAAGNGTPDDFDAIRKAVSEKSGIPAEQVDVERMFVRGEHGETAPVPPPGKPGEFVPRRNADGVPVDEDGHEYGGLYL